MMKKSSSSKNEPCCSKDYKKNTESLNNKIDELKEELYEANVYRHSYKLKIDQLEDRLAEYKEREVKYIETIRSLERDKECNLRKINKLTSDVETLQDKKDLVDGKLARLLKSSKDLEDIIESQRSEKVKEGLGYNAVPPPAADLYLSPKKDLSWTGLLEFIDDTVTDYSRPSPTVASTSTEDKNNDTSTSEETASTNPSKPFIKQSNRRPKGNQRNWNNLKSYQLGPEFVLHKKVCFNCGDFSHLAKDCRRRVQRESTRSQNHSYKSSTHRSAGHRPNGAHMRPPLRSSGPRPHGNPMRPLFILASHRPHGPSINPRRPTMNGARPYKAPWVPTVN
nr:ubiquitin hydrolase [Tanacetum cinerariifolium]